MEINKIGGMLPEMPKLGQIRNLQGGGFTEMFTSFIENVNNAQAESSQKVKDFAEGKPVELHEVMIAGEKAKTSLELLMEIRNKTVDMYKELTRMQV